MDFGAPLTLSDNPAPTRPERRFSVHDVQPDDNVVTYGQPDNMALDAPTRITNISSDVEDGSDIKKSKSLHSTRSSGDDGYADADDGDIGGAMIIQQTVDNNEEYATEQMAGSYAVDDARDSISHSPMTVDGKELFDPSHYRHPSLKDHEVPLHDDMDEPKDHNRFASVIRKDVPDMDSLERKRISENHSLSVLSVLLSVAILRNLSLIQIESTLSKFRF